MESVTTVTEIFTNYAFPTAVVIILMIFIFLVLRSYKQSVDAQKDDIKELNKQYHDDYAKISDALNNNTNALNSLSKMVDFFIRRFEDQSNDGR